MASDYSDLIAQAEAKYGLPKGLLAGLVQTESGGNPSAVSSQGAQGLTQLMPQTQKALGVTNPNDPAQSIDAGAKQLAENLKASKGDVLQALKMYHGGPNQQIWGEKTNSYPGKVLANMPKQDITLDDLNAMMGQQAAPQAQAAPAAPVTLDDLHAIAGQEVMPGDSPVSSGFERGVRDVIDKPAEKLNKPLSRYVVGVNRLLGLPDDFQAQMAMRMGVSSDSAHKFFPYEDRSGIAGLVNNGPTAIERNDAADRAAFESQYGNSKLAGITRTGGQVAVIAPVLSAGGALAGGAMEGAAGSMAATNPLASQLLAGSARFLGGSAGAGAPGIAGLGTRLASQAANGAITGGAAAALASSASDKPMADQVKEGATVGAILGPVGGLASQGLGYLYGIGKNMLSPLTDMSAQATQRAAANKLVSKLVADGMKPEQAIARARELGPEATLADVGGANVRNTAEAIANSPGAGSGIAQEALESRAAGQAGRVNDALKQATGVDGNVYDQADQLIQQRRQAAAPLYEKAMANDVVPNDMLGVQLKNPLVQQAMQDGAKIAQTEAAAEGRAFNPAEYFGPDGQIPETPSMRALDAAKQGLDDMLEKYRDPTTGKMSLDSQGRAIEKLRQSFVANLDQLNPDYAAARAAYAGPSQSLDAMNMGKRALSNDPEVNAKIVGNLSPGDKQFYLQGVTRAIQDKIASAQDGADVTRKIFGNNLMRDKIAAAFDNPEAFQQFQKTMEAEAMFAQTRNAVLKGSQTARRLAGQADLSTPVADAARNLLQGNLGSAAASAVRGVGNYLMQPSAAQSEAAGKMLFTPEGINQLEQTINAMKPGPAKQALGNLLSTGKQAVLPAAVLQVESARR